MIHIINSTDINIQPTDSSPDMRALQDTTILPRNQWPDQQSGNSNGSYLSGNSCLTCYNTSLKPVVTYDPLGGHNIWQVILIVFFTGLLSLVTIIGNILVLVSFKVNKQLKTVNNYFLLSLAFADLIIGVSSMNLYTTYIIMDKWALGSWACDLWLAIDYVASNASVMNLLVISFDRYFSITRPLTYRAKRTTKRAGIMIGLAWAISFVLWAPAILFWQYFVGVRTVPHDKCYIQFLSEPIITFCTAIAAFYLPVTIMTVLYWRIYKETENRSKELACLQATGSEAETAQFVQQTGSSRSCGSFEVCRTSRRKSVGKDASRFYFWPISSRSWKLDSSSDSWNNDTGISADQSGSSDEEEMAGSHAIFSIILNFPGIKAVGSSRFTCQEEPEASEMDPLKAEKPVKNREEGNKTDSDTPQQHFSKIGGGTDTIASKTSSISSSFKEAVLFKRCTARTRTQITKRKRMSLVKEKKAAQTLSAILLAFIITWTPYNIMVLINTFCNNCIPESLWALGYWLCYVNSTVNPMCYALCNKTFRTTFKMILLCRWDSWSRNNQKFQRPAVVFHRRISEEPP